MNKGCMMFLIFVVLGLLISLQFRSIVQSKSDNTTTIRELASELEAERAEKERLLEQLVNLEAEHKQLIKNISSNLNDKEAEELLRQRDYEFLRAGLLPVTGRGIIITMEDASEIGELDADDYIVHDRDVNMILDELKVNGAQAISINGERVIFSTKPVCAGPTIIVNERRYPAPYVIKAIGDPDVLFEAIETMAPVAFLRLCGIRIDIVKQDNIVVDGYHFYKTPLNKMFQGLEAVENEGV